jgi:hypothetical protein
MVLDFFLAVKQCMLHQSRFPDPWMAFNPEDSVIALQISTIFPFPKGRGFEEPLARVLVS